MSDSLLEDLSTFYYRRPHKFAIKSLCSSGMKSGSYDSRVYTNTTRTSKNVTLYTSFLSCYMYTSLVYFFKEQLRLIRIFITG